MNNYSKAPTKVSGQSNSCSREGCFMALKKLVSLPLRKRSSFSFGHFFFAQRGVTMRALRHLDSSVILVIVAISIDVCRVIFTSAHS